jgi:hypothetical protein
MLTRLDFREEKKSEKDTKRDGPNSRTRQQQRNNKDNKGKRNAPQIIQTHGFLSEGIAGVAVQKRFGSGGGGEFSGGASSREAGGAEAISRPRIIKRDTRQNKEDLETEQRVLLDFLADDDSDTDEDNRTGDDIMPVKIKNGQYLHTRKESVEYPKSFLHIYM